MRKIKHHFQKQNLSPAQTSARVSARVRRLEAERHRRLIETRDLLHLSFRFQALAATRLDELHAGAEQASANEAEVCWDILSLSFSYERDLTRRYCEAAGLECEYA